MASQDYDFTTDSDYDVQEREVLGSVPGAGLPIVKLKIGASLFRLMHEYGKTGIAMGGLELVPNPRPNVMLSAMNPSSRLSLIPAISLAEIFPDPSATADYRHLQAEHDGSTFEVIAIDATYTSGDIACPEFNTWCEAFGGTYIKSIP